MSDGTVQATPLVFSEHVHEVWHEGRRLVIIGTAHISQRSVEEVQEVIESLRPDTVCVELDATRHAALIDESRWRKLDLFQVIKQKKVLLLLANLALSSYQRRLGDKLGVRPGAELKAAVDSAAKVGAQLVLADREVQVTLKRSWHSLSFWEQAQLVALLLAVPFAKQEIDAEEVERLKSSQHLSQVMREFAQSMPRLQRPLIDERDRYLMSKVQESTGQTVVVVVGAGHVEGMLGYLGQAIDREALEAVPPPSAMAKAMQWLVPGLLLAAFAVGGWHQSGQDFWRQGFWQMLAAWWLPNAIGSSLFGVLALARWQTVLVAFFTSPFAALNPVISVGMITGLVEAWLRRPTVEDCEGIPRAMDSLRGIYANPATRVLWVAVATTLGSVFGTWVGLGWVASLIATGP